MEVMTMELTHKHYEALRQAGNNADILISKTAIVTNIREVYAEAKAQGFDPRIMRKIVRLRTMAPMRWTKRRP